MDYDWLCFSPDLRVLWAGGWELEVGGWVMGEVIGDVNVDEEEDDVWALVGVEA